MKKLIILIMFCSIYSAKGMERTPIEKIRDLEITNKNLQDLLMQQKNEALKNLVEAIKLTQTVTVYNPEKHNALKGKWVITTQGGDNNLPKVVRINEQETGGQTIENYTFKPFNKLNKNLITHIIE